MNVQWTLLEFRDVTVVILKDIHFHVHSFIAAFCR